ncbi:unnamed protein product, partial [Polarella glacialis]
DTAADDEDDENSSNTELETSESEDFADSETASSEYDLSDTRNLCALTVMHSAKLCMQKLNIPHGFLTPPPGTLEYTLAAGCTGAGTPTAWMQVSGIAFAEIMQSESDIATRQFLSASYPNSERLFKACAVGRLDLGECIKHDAVCSPSGSEDMLVAGPPCPPFPTLNPRRRLPKYNPFEEPKAQAIIDICRHIRRRQPKSFVIEEVTSVYFPSPKTCKGPFFNRYKDLPLETRDDSAMDTQVAGMIQEFAHVPRFFRNLHQASAQGDCRADCRAACEVEHAGVCRLNGILQEHLRECTRKPHQPNESYRGLWLAYTGLRKQIGLRAEGGLGSDRLCSWHRPTRQQQRS